MNPADEQRDYAEERYNGDLLRDHTELLECLEDYGLGTCSGAVAWRPSLSGTGTLIARCDGHWATRLEVQAEIDARYPVLPPADFDPSYAGERWEEDY